jgi:hypothetical protein
MNNKIWTGTILAVLFASTLAISNAAQTNSISAAAAQQTNPKPPACDAPEHRQFDFWVGEWDVYVKGKKTAHSSIQNILAGCVIFENWEPFNGGPGKSFNYYDPQVKKWRQLWVSTRPGGAVNFVGERKGNTMMMESDSVDADGVRRLTRMTWTDLGADKVRQLWEQSTDGGKTWTVSFDGEYRRQP